MNSIKIVFLGTSCSTPTPERNLSSIAMRIPGEVLLFDCPEGTQRQMMQAKVSYMQVKRIFLSHLHADHVLGLSGMLATMSIHARAEPVFIYGPRGTKEMLEKILSIGLLGVNFEVVCKEAKRGIVVDEKGYTVSAFPLKHDVPCFGYVFLERGKAAEFQRAKAEALGIPPGPLYSKLQKGESIKWKGKTVKPEDVLDYTKGRRGKKISIVNDTLAFAGYMDEIRDSDLLVHEASFLESMKARAKETMHSTAKQAAEAAAKTNCKKLALTHISPRHKSAEDIENEARQAFGEVVVAKDFLEIEV